MHEKNKMFQEFINYLNERTQSWNPSGFNASFQDYLTDEGIIRISYSTKYRGGREINLMIDTGTGISERIAERIRLFTKGRKTDKILTPSEIFNELNLGLLGMDSQDIKLLEDKVWKGYLGVSPRDGDNSELLDSKVVGGTVEYVECQIAKYNASKGGFMLQKAKKSPKDLVELAVEIYTS